MTGMITAIKRNAIHDGDGLRTTVFFKGCPLKCLWCHNPEGISRQVQVAKYDHLCMGCGRCGGKKTAEAAENCPTGALVRYGKAQTVEALLPVLLQDKPFYDNIGLASSCPRLLCPIRQNGQIVAIATVFLQDRPVLPSMWATTP